MTSGRWSVTAMSAQETKRMVRSTLCNSDGTIFGFPLTEYNVQHATLYYASSHNKQGFSTKTGSAGRKCFMNFLKRQPQITIKSGK